MANYRGTVTLFKRETKRFLKVYTQTIFSPVISNLLYLAIFGLSMKRAIPMEGDVTYLQFLVPGLIMMGIINNAFQNPSSSIVIMRYQGLLESLMTIPLKRIEILIAFMGSAVLRGLIVGTATLITGLFFVSFTTISIPIILFASITVALFFGFAGLVAGIWATEFDKIAFLTNFVLMPLIFLGGVFYPISSLPPLFANVSSFNPIVYMIDLLRYGFTGVNDFSLIFSMGIISTATIAMGIIAYTLLARGYKLQN